jgi:hypothetical protein
VQGAGASRQANQHVRQIVCLQMGQAAGSQSREDSNKQAHAHRIGAATQMQMHWPTHMQAQWPTHAHPPNRAQGQPPVQIQTMFEYQPAIVLYQPCLFPVVPQVTTWQTPMQAPGQAYCNESHQPWASQQPYMVESNVNMKHHPNDVKKAPRLLECSRQAKDGDCPIAPKEALLSPASPVRADPVSTGVPNGRHGRKGPYEKNASAAATPTSKLVPVEKIRPTTSELASEMSSFLF